VVLILASITLITLGYRGSSGGWLRGTRSLAADAFNPVQSAVRSAFAPVGTFFVGAARYGSVKTENAKLHQQVTRLQARAAQADVYRRQVAALRAQDHLAFGQNLPSVVTDVVAGSPSNFQNTVQVDKGSAEGVQVGMPVVSGTGLVGRVVAVSHGQSTVQLASDPNSSLGVRFGPNSQLALAVGQGGGKPLLVDYIPTNTRLTKGEVMVTAGGQGDLYPPGIPVGTVQSAVQKPGSLQETVTLKPFVNLRQLQLASILKWTPGNGAVP
jgi:rod shape-determining protein MreC